MVAEHGWTWLGSIAIGDTLSDLPMLERVESPLCFNPSQELFNEAVSRNWPVILERKNVIYHLNKTSIDLHQKLEFLIIEAAL